MSATSVPWGREFGLDELDQQALVRLWNQTAERVLDERMISKIVEADTKEAARRIAIDAGRLFLKDVSIAIDTYLRAVESNAVEVAN